MGDIGKPLRHIEFEPFPETAPSEPVHQPTTTPAPEREPERTPA